MVIELLIKKQNKISLEGSHEEILNEWRQPLKEDTPNGIKTFLESTQASFQNTNLNSCGVGMAVHRPGATMFEHLWPMMA